MTEKSFQDFYQDDFSHCYGCGRHNEKGLQIKSFWDGDEGVCIFKPEAYHTALPGFVYGGLIASLIDCHAMGTASAAKYRDENREIGSEPPLRYVTASLHVDYLKPTPMGIDLEIRAKATELKGKKAVVDAWIIAGGVVCAKGKVVGIQMPDSMMIPKAESD